MQSTSPPIAAVEATTTVLDRGVSEALSIVIPVYNEESIILDVVTRLSRALSTLSLKAELIVCENGSTDVTRPLLELLVERCKNVRVLAIAKASYGAALREGILEATGEFVIIFNADLWSMKFLTDSLVMLKAGCDVVVGSKRLDASLDRRPLIRRLITATFNTFLNIAFGFKGTDTHGMKALRRSSVLAQLRACVTHREVFDTELMLRLQRAGKIIRELPTEVRDERPARLSLLRRVPSTVRDLARISKSLNNE